MRANAFAPLPRLARPAGPGNAAEREHFARYRRFVISHHEQPAWHWAATWYDASQRKEVTSPELGDLLDVLDAILG